MFGCEIIYHHNIFKHEKNRLPATINSLKPDYSHIIVAEKSDQPEDWLLHPTGYVFQFDAQKAQKPALMDSMSESDTWSDTWSSDYDNTSSDSTS